MMIALPRAVTWLCRRKRGGLIGSGGGRALIPQPGWKSEKDNPAVGKN